MTMDRFFRRLAQQNRSAAWYRLCRRGLVGWRHRDLTPDDYFIASYPRSGNTWMRFLMFDCAFDRSAEFIDINTCFPGVGDHRKAPKVTGCGGRLIKTHEAHRSCYRRGLYLVRDYRDVAISEYKYLKMTSIDPYERTFAEFLADFWGGKTNGYGPWIEHVSAWTEAASSSDGAILVVRFEDLRSDALGVLRRVLEHAGLQVSAAASEQAVARNDAQAIKERDASASRLVHPIHREGFEFVNGGNIGNWRGEASLVAPPPWDTLVRFREIMERYSYPRPWQGEQPSPSGGTHQ